MSGDPTGSSPLPPPLPGSVAGVAAAVPMDPASPSLAESSRRDVPNAQVVPPFAYRRAVGAAPVNTSFEPLRTEPPPRLFVTWWLRYILFLTILVTIAVVLSTEYGTGPGGLERSAGVVTAHLLVAALLVSWSALAMLDARRLVPATRYHTPARAWVVIVLWLVAFAAPVAAIRAVDWARERFADSSDDIGVALVAVGSVMLTFLLVWLPFRYHARQGHRIGAPARVFGAWFWVPLIAAVGGLAIDALGLRDLLAEDGMSALERTIEVGVVYGLPMLMFALSTWRATTVFDEVIDLRWRRWRTEWEQTLAAMNSQPPPPPEQPAITPG